MVDRIISLVLNLTKDRQVSVHILACIQVPILYCGIKF